MKIEKEDKKEVQKEMDEALHNVLNAPPIDLPKEPIRIDPIEKRIEEVRIIEEKKEQEEKSKKDLIEEILNSEPIKFIWEIAKALIRKKLKIKKED